MKILLRKHALLAGLMAAVFIVALNNATGTSFRAQATESPDSYWSNILCNVLHFNCTASAPTERVMLQQGLSTSVEEASASTMSPEFPSADSPAGTHMTTESSVPATDVTPVSGTLVYGDGTCGPGKVPTVAAMKAAIDKAMIEEGTTVTAMLDARDCGNTPAAELSIITDTNHNAAASDSAVSDTFDSTAAPECGNGQCELILGENQYTCAQDCALRYACDPIVDSTGQSCGCPGFPTCNAHDTVLPVCGNGVCDTDENAVTCSDDCGGDAQIDVMLGVCGNSIVEQDEECDDGNLNNGDGCSVTCLIEKPVAGDTTCSDSKQGEITEYAIPTLHSAPQGITYDPDGDLYFTELGAEKIGRITPKGIVTAEYPIDGYPYDIAFGPDGNLWITVLGGPHKIVRMTTEGKVTGQFTVKAGGFPHRITAGPDALYFTEWKGDAVDSINTEGVIKRYPVLTKDSLPEGVAASSDGKYVFYTLQSTNKVGRVTLSTGKVDEVTVDWAQNIHGITADADGVAIITEDSLGLGTTSFKKYFWPNGGGGYSVTFGPDKNVWAALNGANKIMRLTTAGKFTEFVVPTKSSTPWGITTGPDTAIWFTETDGNKIGRIPVSDCSETASAITCGNGIVEKGEECDDGNTKDMDGCSSTCRKEVPPTPVCGNGIVDPGEVCDLGSKNGTNGCSKTCEFVYCQESDCPGPVPVTTCMDSSMTPALFACNDTFGQPRCVRQATNCGAWGYCGDGVMNGAAVNGKAIEECDPGMDATGHVRRSAGCDANCKKHACTDVNTLQNPTRDNVLATYALDKQECGTNGAGSAACIGGHCTFYQQSDCPVGQTFNSLYQICVQM